MTRVRGTSRAAYREIQGKIGPQQRIVLNYLSAVPAGATRKEIGRALTLEANVATARIKELLDSGNLEEAPGKRICTITGKKVHIIRCPIVCRKTPAEAAKPPPMAKIINSGTRTQPIHGGFTEIHCIDLELSDGSIHSKLTRAMFDADIVKALHAGLANRSDIPVAGKNIQVKHLIIYNAYHTRKNEQTGIF